MPSTLLKYFICVVGYFDGGPHHQYSSCIPPCCSFIANVRKMWGNRGLLSLLRLSFNPIEEWGLKIEIMSNYIQLEIKYLAHLSV